MSDIRDHGGIFGGGGKSSLNVYSRLTEPEKKEGVWIQTETKKSKVVSEKELWFSRAWNDETLKTYSKIPLNTNVNVASVAAIGKYVYVVNDSDGVLLRYDTKGNTWSSMPSTPIVFSGKIMVAINNKLYIQGIGYRHFCFDTETNIWTQLANIPFDVTNGSTVTVGKMIYLFGGTNSTKTAYSYDTETTVWTKLPDIPYHFFEGDAAAVGGKIYLVGGSGSPAVQSVYAYDIATNTWNVCASVPQSIKKHVAVAIDTYIYVIGGIGTTTATNILIYDTILNNWRTGDTLPYSVFDHDAIFCDNGIYLMGGASPDNISRYTEVRKYNFTSKTFEDRTIVVYRPSEVSGNYQTELITPQKNKFTGVNTRLVIPFDNVYMYFDDLLQENLPTYYGDGEKWVKIKG